MKSLIHTPEGVRDIYGKEYAEKLMIEDRIHAIISGYGFEDIQTPGFEFFDVFSKEIGTTTSKELYKFFDKEGETLVLRPDFTPSIARCAAKYYLKEVRPIRLQYLGNTYTNTSNLQGKLKEMTEMGAELINDASVEADAEMIATVVDSLKSSGLRDFQISIGEVNYFKGLCQEYQLTEDTINELREYISIKNIFGAREYLLRQNLSAEQTEKLLHVYDMFGQAEVLQTAMESTNNETSKKAVSRLQKLHEKLCLYGVNQYVSYDLGMLSKFHYYTGVIFKAYTYGVGDAIVKGGRYDNLLSKFGKESPAIGFVILIDDLMSALSRQNIIVPIPEQSIEIFYSDEDYNEKLTQAKMLRSQGKKVALKSIKTIDIEGGMN